jgi:hypothetical protein
VKRATEEEWARRVSRWRASGLSAAEYGRRSGLSEKTLRWWKWRFAAAARLAKTDAPLTFVEVTPQREAIEIVLASGTRIRLPSDFEASALARALDVLERKP